MKFLFRILRRLVGYLLGVLVALIAAAATFGWQGYKLYQSAVQATPLETLYQSITARPSFVPYDQLPQTYIDAVLSVDDSRFVHHHGVDPLSIARALWADLRSGTLAEGGSTITQQLAKMSTSPRKSGWPARRRRCLPRWTSRSITPNRKFLRCTSTPSTSATAAMAWPRPPRGILRQTPPL